MPACATWTLRGRAAWGVDEREIVRTHRGVRDGSLPSEEGAGVRVEKGQDQPVLNQHASQQALALREQKAKRMRSVRPSRRNANQCNA